MEVDAADHLDDDCQLHDGSESGRKSSHGEGEFFSARTLSHRSDMCQGSSHAPVHVRPAGTFGGSQLRNQDKYKAGGRHGTENALQDALPVKMTRHKPKHNNSN